MLRPTLYMACSVVAICLAAPAAQAINPYAPLDAPDAAALGQIYMSLPGRMDPMTGSAALPEPVTAPKLPLQQQLVITIPEPEEVEAVEVVEPPVETASAPQIRIIRPDEPRITAPSPEPEFLQWPHDEVSGAPLPATKPAFTGDVLTRQVTRGDTLGAILQSAGAESIVADAAMKAVRPLFDPANLKPGQTITMRMTRHAGRPRLDGFDLTLDVDTRLEVNRVGPSTFIASLDTADTLTRLAYARGQISSGLMVDGRDAGIPNRVLMNLIRHYDGRIDFTRDLHKGDMFELVYEMQQNSAGQDVRAGHLIYANLILRGEENKIYRYRSSKGEDGYFAPDGTSGGKTLLAPPVKGLRVSSGFGPRWHPVLKQRRMHKGIDYAGATGTQVLAAGDGVIELAGRRGTFGNYIQIQHAQGIETAYAHLHRIARGISPGTRVRQGQVIGYIGTTGRSTGPHLHYEVHSGGKAIDPQKMRMPRAVALGRSDLAAFRQHVGSIDRQVADLAAASPMRGQMANSQ